MKLIQYKLTEEEQDLINLAMTSGKHKYLKDHKKVYMNHIMDVIRSLSRK